jgi:hypothetical protein
MSRADRAAAAAAAATSGQFTSAQSVLTLAAQARPGEPLLFRLLAYTMYHQLPYLVALTRHSHAVLSHQARTVE